MLLGSLRSTKEVQDMSTKFMYSGSIAMGLSMGKKGVAGNRTTSKQSAGLGLQQVACQHVGSHVRQHIQAA